MRAARYERDNVINRGLQGLREDVATVGTPAALCLENELDFVVGVVALGVANPLVAGRRYLSPVELVRQLHGLRVVPNRMTAIANDKGPRKRRVADGFVVKAWGVPPKPEVSRWVEGVVADTVDEIRHLAEAKNGHVQTAFGTGCNSERFPFKVSDGKGLDGESLASASNENSSKFEFARLNHESATWMQPSARRLEAAKAWSVYPAREVVGVQVPRGLSKAAVRPLGDAICML
jgi:hypothetical protein